MPGGVPGNGPDLQVESGRRVEVAIADGGVGRRAGEGEPEDRRQVAPRVDEFLGVAGAGKTDKWDGTVDLTPKALLDARARNLKNVVAELEAAAAPAPAEAPAKKAAPKKAAAKKSDAAE